MSIELRYQENSIYLNNMVFMDYILISFSDVYLLVEFFYRIHVNTVWYMMSKFKKAGDR